MIERIWSGRSPLYILLLPLSWLYGLISTLLRQTYIWGWRTSWKASVPIVVVGNLTAGGNGKTPVVIWLVETLQQRGFRVGVVSRGYGGQCADYPLVVTNKTTATEAGDEPVLIHQRTGAPVVVAPKRTAAVKKLLENNAVDLVISDDGLQHYALARDIELVVIDGMRRFGNGWWLPAGPMRERVGRLKSVDAVITNGGVPHEGEIMMKLHPGLAVNLLTGERRLVTDLGNDVVAMAGIGHPPRFFATLETLNVVVNRTISFADHQVYTASQLTTLTTENQILLMTEKDAVKCREFAHKNWWYLPVEAQFSGAEMNVLLDKVEQLTQR